MLLPGLHNRVANEECRVPYVELDLSLGKVQHLALKLHAKGGLLCRGRRAVDVSLNERRFPDT